MGMCFLAFPKGLWLKSACSLLPLSFFILLPSTASFSVWTNCSAVKSTLFRSPVRTSCVSELLSPAAGFIKGLCTPNQIILCNWFNYTNVDVSLAIGRVLLLVFNVLLNRNECSISKILQYSLNIVLCVIEKNSRLFLYQCSLEKWRRKANATERVVTGVCRQSESHPVGSLCHGPMALLLCFVIC